jgi:hypothetical protein
MVGVLGGNATGTTTAITTPPPLSRTDMGKLEVTLTRLVDEMVTMHWQLVQSRAALVGTKEEVWWIERSLVSADAECRVLRGDSYCLHKMKESYSRALVRV